MQRMPKFTNLMAKPAYSTRHRMRRATLRLLLTSLLCAGGVTFHLAPGQAQAPVQGETPRSPNTGPSPTTPSPTVSLTDQIIRGRVQLEAGNRQAIATLQTAAQQSLAPLNTVAGPEILTMKPESMPKNPAFGLILRQAAEAHFWWGVAADRFASRDIALTAFARAARFYAGDRSGTYSAARESMANLRGSLTEGLPQFAPDDTLDTIASLAHGGLWRPLRLIFDFNSNTFTPSVAHGEQSKGQQEFLITDGKVFLSGNSRDPKANLKQIPPPFRHIANDALPRAMSLSNVIIGYVRETEGANRGLWRQSVRVRYPHQSLTAKNRDDRPRATALCLQFLKLHVLMRRAVGLENAYSLASLGTSNSVTTIWLSEVSALWPVDEDDPAVLAALGMVFMPKVNAPGTKIREDVEVDVSPLSRPWLVAGQMDDAPGDIVFYKTAQPRSEAEWLRELAHEYGHVALPPFNGFRPPLEPYGNGALGETLSMMWVASAPDVFKAPEQEIVLARKGGSTTLPRPIVATTAVPSGVHLVTETSAIVPVVGAAPPMDDFGREALNHVETYALPSLNFWNAQGPGSTLRRDGNDAGLKYLQGLATYVERVYGAPLLGEAMGALQRVAEVTPKPEDVVPGNGAVGSPLLLVPNSPPPAPMQAPALLENVAAVLKNPFADGQTILPVWLPGALVMPTTKLTAQSLVTRAPLGLKAGERATCWLYVPTNAAALRIEWKSASTGPLTIEGGWRSALLSAAQVAASQSGATQGVRIETVGRPGWQRFAFTAPADLTWSGAWFEKSKALALPPAPRP